jgi:RHS repeat-associated protein
MTSCAGMRYWVFVVLLSLCVIGGVAAPVSASTDFLVDAYTPAPLPDSVLVKSHAVQPLLGGTSAIDPAIDYPNLIRAQGTTGSLGNDLFGESVDYYTGQADFVATDVSVPLNSALSMAVSRRYRVGNRTGGTLPGQFGDWDLDLPHIEVVLAASVGWQVPGMLPFNQCSNFTAPKDATVTAGTSTTTIPASEYSQGYQLVIPGQGRRELLLRAAGNGYAPSGDYAHYPVVTHDWWAATCQRSTAPRRTGDPSEDFVVTSPDGVTYAFSYYSTRPYPSYQRIADDQTSTSGTLAVLPRVQGLMLPDTITDRFGNWVQYHYVQDSSMFGFHLNKITSSDGHTITLTLNSDFTVKQIENNTAGNGKVWTYTYTSGALTKVTLPDGSYWNIDFAKLDQASWTYSGTTCTSLPTQTYPSGSSLSASGSSANSVSGTLQQPSGALGAFTFTVKRQGRNNAPATCLKNAVGTSFAAQQPGVYDVLSLTNKAISGPHLPSAYVWKVAYAGCTSSSCSATKTTTITDARGFDTTYTFGAHYDATASADTEGQVQTVQEGGKGAANYLRTTNYTYFANCGASCPAAIGTPAQARGDAAPLSTLKPIATRTIAQDGANYTLTANNPDKYGFAQTITRSDGADSKTETLIYGHDAEAWVLGTITQKTSDGKPEFKLTLDAFDEPKELDRFGLKIRTYTHHNDGTLWTATDGKGQTTTYDKYVSGIPQSIAYANGDSESAAVRYDGRITSWTDADSNKTSYDYDNAGRLKLITYPTDAPSYASRSIAWTTAATGWTQTETAGAYSRTTTYDAFLHPVAIDEANTRHWANAFDADGRTTFASYPGAAANPTDGLTSAYDGLGRLTSVTDAASYSTTYTPAAHRMTVKDRDNNSVTTTYRQYDTPSFDQPVTISSPIATTQIGRDAWGFATSITRGAIARTRTYNAYQQLQSVTDPERTDKLLFDYDDAGNLWHIKRDGTVAETRAYDKRNRLTSIDYAGTDPSATFDWWPSGAIKSQSRGTNSHAYTYNARHEIKSETIATNNGTYKLAYGYDNLAHLSSFTYPDNTQITYQPDALGQPAQIGVFATFLHYYANGAVKSFSYGNGIAHSMNQSSDGRQLPALVTDLGVENLGYTFDGNGFPLTIFDHAHTLRDAIFTYDSANRLKTADAANLWGATVYTYDANDTLTLDQTGSVSTVYAMDSRANLPLSLKIGTAAAIPLTWDGEGNLIQKGTGSTTSVFTFDGANELVELTQNGATYDYAYDGQGLRATSRVPIGSGSTQQIDSIYNASGQLVYENAAVAPPPDRIFLGNFETPAAAQTTRYIYLGNHAIAKSLTSGTTTTTTYIHTDALGTPIAQTDSAKKVIGTSAYLPYGGLLSSTGTGNVAGLGFAGASSDASGLVYMHARYLDPQLRRFISLDPVDVDANTGLNFNRLSYAGNSPYAKIDASGRDAVFIYNGDGSRTLLIPVHFVGASVTAAVISRVLARDNGLQVSDPNLRMDVVSTDKPIYGVLNTMDYSPGYDTKLCGSVGECINHVGGSKGHINSDNLLSTDAVAHDVLHFAGIRDQYVEGPADSEGNRTSVASHGYDDSNIMTSRSGTDLTPDQFNESESNPSTVDMACADGDSEDSVCF